MQKRIQFCLVVAWLMLPWLVWAAELPDADSTEVKAYKVFANAFIYGRLEEARTMTVNEKVRTILDRKEKLNGQEGGVRPIDETLFMIIDQRKMDKGRTKIHGVQVIQYKEPANEPPVFHRQFVTLQQEGQRWLVEEFMDEEEECCK